MNKLKTNFPCKLKIFDSLAKKGWMLFKKIAFNKTSFVCRIYFTT